MKIKRTGSTNNRVTRGKIYVVDSNHITDDNGEKMIPSICPGYWEIVEPHRGEKLSIRQVTLINGKEDSSYTTADLFDLLMGEVELLEKYNTAENMGFGKYTSNHVKACETNITVLTSLLDTREDL